MQPQTEGLEEQGPDRVPFVNDPAKHRKERVEPSDDEADDEPEDE